MRLSPLVAIALATNFSAAQIVPEDPNGVLDKNGVKILNIKAPNADGVSFNNYQKFSVNASGAVINNATQARETILAGRIEANPNLKGSPADIAVLRVTGENLTRLQGAIEAASKNNMKLYISNQNGIIIDGLSLINLKDVTLTTADINEKLIQGAPKGFIEIKQNGTKGVVNLKLIAKTINNKGTVVGLGEIEAIIGDKNGQHYLTSALGSIYADQIKIKSKSDFLNVNVEELLAQNNISIDIKGDLINQGTIAAKKDLSIKARNLKNQGYVDFNEAAPEISYISANGEVLSAQDIEKKWQRRYTKTLTSNDTWLLMTGTLLNQWAYDEENVKTASPNANVLKRFNDGLKEIASKDEFTTLLRQNQKEISDTQKDGHLVNSGEFYDVLSGGKKLLAPVVKSRTQATQTFIQGQNINIELSGKLDNKDAIIAADKNLKIKADEISNQNSISDPIALKQGFEKISWEIKPKFIPGTQRVADATYEISYERGLQASSDQRVSATNTSLIKGDAVRIEAKTLTLHDQINTGVSVLANTAQINADKISLKGQTIRSGNINIQAKNTELTDAALDSQNINISSDVLNLKAAKKQDFLKISDKERASTEVASGSALKADKNIFINANSVNLDGSIISAKENSAINAEVLNLNTEVLNSSYNQDYHNPKTFRHFYKNQTSQTAFDSFVTAKNAVINANQISSKGGSIIGTNSVLLNSQNTKIDTQKLNSVLTQRLGIDNGILGTNHSKLRKENLNHKGSLVSSNNELLARAESEFALIGSKIQAQNLSIQAANLKIQEAKNKERLEASTHSILGNINGTSSGTASTGFAKDNLNANIQGEIYKNEKLLKETSTSVASSVEAETASLEASKKLEISGSNVEANELNLKSNELNIVSATDTTESHLESTTATGTVITNFGIGASPNRVDSKVELTVNKKKEYLKEDTNVASNLKANNINIQTDSLNIAGSNVKGKDVNILATNANISSSAQKSEYTKSENSVTTHNKVQYTVKILKILDTLKNIGNDALNIQNEVQDTTALYEKIKDYYYGLGYHYKDIKKFIDAIKNKDYDPVKLGLQINNEVGLAYNNSTKKELKTTNIASNIEALNLNINVKENLNLSASKIKADSLNLNANYATLVSKADTISAQNEGGGFKGFVKHDMISKFTGGIGGFSTTTTKNESTTHASAQISSNSANISTNKDLKLSGANIDSKQTNLKVGGETIIHHNADIIQNSHLATSTSYNSYETYVRNKIEVAKESVAKLNLSTINGIVPTNAKITQDKEYDSKIKFGGVVDTGAPSASMTGLPIEGMLGFSTTASAPKVDATDDIKTLKQKIQTLSK